MSFLKILKKIDYFAVSLQLKFLGEKKFPSLLGSVLTLLMVSIGLSIFFTQGFDFIEKKKP